MRSSIGARHEKWSALIGGEIVAKMRRNTDNVASKKQTHVVVRLTKHQHRKQEKTLNLSMAEKIPLTISNEKRYMVKILKMLACTQK